MDNNYSLVDDQVLYKAAAPEKEVGLELGTLGLYFHFLVPRRVGATNRESLLFNLERNWLCKNQFRLSR